MKIDKDLMIEEIAKETDASQPILPGSTVTVNNCRSIYNGYQGFVQRISGNRAAVLFEGGNWDKLVTIDVSDLIIT